MSASSSSSFPADPKPDPAAQGQAALLLVESLIHTLLDDGTLSKEQAMEAIRSAEEVKEESAGDRKEAEATLRKSVQLIADMRLSIAAHSGRYDADRGSDDPDRG